jgi:hypothetical protein
MIILLVRRMALFCSSGRGSRLVWGLGLRLSWGCGDEEMEMGIFARGFSQS